MVDFIHNNKELYGVEGRFVEFTLSHPQPITGLLGDLCENPEHRAKQRFMTCIMLLRRLNEFRRESSGRYGVRKVWQKLKREGYIIARCTVARLMKN